MAGKAKSAIKRMGNLAKPSKGSESLYAAFAPKKKKAKKKGR